MIAVHSRRSQVLAICIVAISACRAGGHPSADTAVKARASGPAQPRAHELAISDTGHVVHRGTSSYAVSLADSTCSGHRVVNERFELVAGLVVKITQDNRDLRCVEGMISTMTAMVWRAGPDGALLDSITSGSASARVLNPSRNNDRPVPLLEGLSEGCCGSPPTYEYWNLQTGKRVFTGETPILYFFANGAVRFLSVAGGSAGRVATVEYGTGAGETQRLTIPAPAGVKTDGFFAVDSAAIEGPYAYNGGVGVGSECCPRKDTVPVSGVTLHLRVREMSGDPTLDFVARIVNDRLVLSGGSAPP